MKRRMTKDVKNDFVLNKQKKKEAKKRRRRSSKQMKDVLLKAKKVRAETNERSKRRKSKETEKERTLEVW